MKKKYSYNHTNTYTHHPHTPQKKKTKTEKWKTSPNTMYLLFSPLTVILYSAFINTEMKEEQWSSQMLSGFEKTHTEKRDTELMEKIYLCEIIAIFCTGI